jgi:hypothetical protein
MYVQQLHDEFTVEIKLIATIFGYQTVEVSLE